MVLVIVLVVVAVLALGAYAFAELMVSQRAAAKMTGQQLQAKALADSGMDALRVSVTGDESTHGVPVGPTLSLFGIGLAGLGLARWHGARRRG